MLHWFLKAAIKNHLVLTTQYKNQAFESATINKVKWFGKCIMKSMIILQSHSKPILLCFRNTVKEKS
jgi:hypothetical protein